MIYPLMSSYQDPMALAVQDMFVAPLISWRHSFFVARLSEFGSLYYVWKCAKVAGFKL